jgi:hypothetical protein
MDPISIGATVGTLLVARLTKKLLENAIDPEAVAKGVNWVFSAVDHFLKVRKNERDQNAAIPAPPASAAPVEVNAAAVAEKTTAVEHIAQSLKPEISVAPGEGVHLVALDDFTLEQLTKDIESLLKQLDTYLGNLRFEEEKAALHGGVQFVPPIVMNSIRIQREEIARRVVRLNLTMKQTYGVAAPNLEILITATEK